MAPKTMPTMSSRIPPTSARPRWLPLEEGLARLRKEEEEKAKKVGEEKEKGEKGEDKGGEHEVIQSVAQQTSARVTRYDIMEGIENFQVDAWARSPSVS
ncbi:hypothetical protein N7493_008234 [Penicillium malachiteum]|uniref:Uncharacterized protein n=1 Tax=Penicillium malachiteum TaxID=1324776 RepID=A0AAD6MTK2_9EURO|nr:hypothetical protein N7493_008234 [Penicillium malachiteum]